MLKANSAIFIQGSVGQLETIYLLAQTEVFKGVAVICHPNPLQGGLNTNKVVQTVAKSLTKLGYACYCPNLRGVGQSEGTHDYGVGEVDDVLSVINYAKETHGTDYVALAGFSFGAYVSTFVSQHTAIQKLLLVGAAVGIYGTPAPEVALSTLLIHGEKDDVVPFSNVTAWAAPQNLAIVVVPDTGHFFHGKLLLLGDIVTRYFEH